MNEKSLKSMPHPLQRQMLQYLKNHAPEFENKKIALGFSAGVDSVVLFDLLSRCANFNWDAVHFRHGENNPLIDSKTDDSLKVAQKLCKIYKKPLTVVNLDIQKTPQGWEAEGHAQRRKYIEQHYDIFFLAHHLDDLCENFFLQTLRGAGSAVEIKDEAMLRRPLLSNTKSSLISYAQHLNLPWSEDLTNKDTQLKRNFWRQEALPLIEKHYPSYRSHVLAASEKHSNLLHLARDLACVDGLDNLPSLAPMLPSAENSHKTSNQSDKKHVTPYSQEVTQMINYCATLHLPYSLAKTPHRLENLFYFYFKQNHCSIQKQDIKNLCQAVYKSHSNSTPQSFSNKKLAAQCTLESESQCIKLQLMITSPVSAKEKVNKDTQVKHELPTKSSKTHTPK